MMGIALGVLANNYYNSYTFSHSEIPKKYQQRIDLKEQEILQLMQKNFGVQIKIPIVITNKFEGKLYGLTSYENGKITIYLNKKVMKESIDYMVESVLAHEYAHAFMFHLGYLHTHKQGHSKKWQQTCVKLGGKSCEQYVNRDDVVLGKLPF